MHSASPGCPRSVNVVMQHKIANLRFKSCIQIVVQYLRGRQTSQTTSHATCFDLCRSETSCTRNLNVSDLAGVENKCSTAS